MSHRPSQSTSAAELRSRLVEIALRWQDCFGVAPQITSAISELDAAIQLIRMSEEEYRSECAGKTAVRRGYDFMHKNCRYQVKANRPSGGPRSRVTKVGKAKNYDWDKLIWILYDPNYILQEAWEWKVDKYRRRFEGVKDLRPKHMRQGWRLFPDH